MARVRLSDRDDLPEDYRHLWDKNRAPDGRMGSLIRALAHSPRLMHQFLRFGHDIRRRTRLDGRLRELAICATTLAGGNVTEFRLHFTNDARANGITDEQIAGLAHWETYPGFTEADRAVIRYAVEVTRQVRASDATFNAVRIFLDDQQIVELTLLVGFYNLVSRFEDALCLPFDGV